MGACASVNKSSDSSMRYPTVLVWSKAKKLFVPSPAKEKTVNGGQPIVGFTPKDPDFGSKAEIFFDSRGWLDSDCDDDFFSMNGDFTPSRGTTPIHPINGSSTPKLDSFLFLNNKPDSKPEPSPTGRKKLAELFHEILQTETGPNPTNSGEGTAGIDLKPDVYESEKEQPAKSVNGTPYCSGTSSTPCTETTPNGSIKNKKDKTLKNTNCCLPSLHTFGLNERRQKMSPEILAT